MIQRRKILCISSKKRKPKRASGRNNPTIKKSLMRRNPWKNKPEQTKKTIETPRYKKQKVSEGAIRKRRTLGKIATNLSQQS